MSLPAYRVEAMFGAGPFDVPSGTWVQIPNERVRSIEIRDGRDNELDVFPPSMATIVLRSNDRRYDPAYSAGPHFGGLLPRVPFRIRLSHDGVTWQDWYYGFVRDGWEQGTRKPFVGTCTVELEDLLGVVENEPLPRTAYDAEVLASTPKAFWKLDESAGIQMADSSGNGFHGTIDNAERVDGLVFGSPRALNCPHVGDHRGIFIGEGLPTTAPMSLEAWIKTPRDLAQFKSIIYLQRDASGAPGVVRIAIETGASGSPNGELVIRITGGYAARGSTRLDDDEIHHVVATVAGLSGTDVLLYVDGALETKTVITGSSFNAWPGLLWWTVGNTANIQAGDFGLDGPIDEVAIYNRVLSPAEVSAHYAAGTTAFAGEFSGTRLGRAYDQIGLPTAMRDIATGDTTVGPADYGGDTAGAYAQKVAESEQGYHYVDHRGGGKLKFRGRYDRFTATRSTTSQATLTGKHYGEDVAPEPNGVGSIVNVVDVTWQGGTETVADATSRTAFGARSRSITTEAATPSTARSAGDWMIARYKNPQSRLRSLPIKLSGKPALWSTVLGLRISDRITVERHPQGVGAKITEQLIIERINLRINDDQSWGVELRLSDADDTLIWMWGTGAWGTTAAWG